MPLIQKRKKKLNSAYIITEPKKCILHMVPKNNMLSITACDLERMFQANMDEELLIEHMTTTGFNGCQWSRFFEMLLETLYDPFHEGKNEKKSHEKSADELYERSRTESVFMEMGKGASHAILHIEYYIDESISLKGQMQLYFIESFIHDTCFQHQTIISLFQVAITNNRNPNKEMKCDFLSMQSNHGNEPYIKQLENDNDNDNDNNNENNNENENKNNDEKKEEKDIMTITSISTPTVPLCQYLQVKNQLEELQLKLHQIATQNTSCKDLFSLLGDIKLEHSFHNSFGLDGVLSPTKKRIQNGRKTKKDMDVINPRRKKQRIAGGFVFGQ